MSELILEQTATAQWHRLVHEAEQACGTCLSEDMQSYLVFLLMRYAARPELAQAVMALQYLESCGETGQLRRDHLQEVGDSCLLYSGLYPRQARRRLVRASYYIDLGRTAYHDLSRVVAGSVHGLYRELAGGFVALMEVLQAMRGGSGCAVLDPMGALELFEQTGSRQALERELERLGVDALLVPGLSEGPGKH